MPKKLNLKKYKVSGGSSNMQKPPAIPVKNSPFRDIFLSV